ncbi:hypothetical protein [Acidisoma sp. 7E03]
MPTAHIDVAAEEKPKAGEKFTISKQENSELLGLLDDGRSFRFKQPSKTEEDYEEAHRILTVVSFDLDRTREGEPRLVGALDYSE